MIPKRLCGFQTPVFGAAEPFRKVTWLNPGTPPYEILDVSDLDPGTGRMLAKSACTKTAVAARKGGAQAHRCVSQADLAEFRRPPVEIHTLSTWIAKLGERCCHRCGVFRKAAWLETSSLSKIDPCGAKNCALRGSSGAER